MGSWLNQKRLRDYPRLFFFTTWALLAFNWAFHNGWLGAAGQIIGNDFLVFYSAGALFRSQPQALYDPVALHDIQQALIAPTPLEGLIPYPNPPYVAPAFALLTVLPLNWAFGLWTIANIACLGGASCILVRCVAPVSMASAGLTGWQVFFIVGGYMGFVEGLEVGQSHGITLLLVSVAVAFTLNHYGALADLAAGAAAGLLLIKPQFALAFLLVWLAWSNWRALAGFAITGAVWVCASLALQGIAPYWVYLQLVPRLLEIYHLTGLGSYLEVTLYGFLVSILGPENWSWLAVLNQVLAAAAGAGILVYAWWSRKQAEFNRVAVLIFAVLYPLVFAPHVLLHDSVILAVALLLWCRLERSQALLWSALVVYLAAFLLVWVTYQIGIALLGLVPLGLALCLVWLLRNLAASRPSSRAIF